MANPNVFPRFLKAGAEPITVYPRFLVDSFIADILNLQDPHISELVRGDVIKIVVAPIHQLVIQNTRTGPVLVPGKGRNTRAQTRTAVYGPIQENRPDLGYLRMDVVEHRTVIPATIPYTFIRIIHLLTTFTEGNIETAVNPGAVALGTNLVTGYLHTPRWKKTPIRF